VAVNLTWAFKSWNGSEQLPRLTPEKLLSLNNKSNGQPGAHCQDRYKQTGGMQAAPPRALETPCSLHCTEYRTRPSASIPVLKAHAGISWGPAAPAGPPASPES